MGRLKILDLGAANFKKDDRWVHVQEVEYILFEPDLRSFLELKERGLKVYNYALGFKDERRIFNLTRKPACSSFFIPNMEYLSKFPQKERWDIISKTEIETKLLDFFKLNVDFIKLDTQGSELEILKGASTTLKKVCGLEIEVSFIEIYKGQPLFGEICEFLRINGFEFFDFITEYRYGRKELNRKGQLAFADALFLRSPENIVESNIDKINEYKAVVKAYGKEDLLEELKNKII